MFQINLVVLLTIKCYNLEKKEVIYLLGENIRKYRKLNNMSQDELAEKLNVTRQSISLWETGQTQPSIDNIIALAKLFNIATDDLLIEVGSKTAEGEKNMQTEKRSNKKIILIAVFAVIAVLLAAVLLWKFSASDGEKDTPVIEETNTVKSLDDMYGYFKDFVVQNGELNGDYCSYTNSADYYGGNAAENFNLTYWGDTDTIEFCLHRVLDDTFSINFYLIVPKNYTGKYEYISSHYYRDTGEPLYEAKGVIDAGEFTENYPLTCTKYIGTDDKQNEFMETSRQGICQLLSCLEQFTQVEKTEYTFSDFGFTKF